MKIDRHEQTVRTQEVTLTFRDLADLGLQTLLNSGDGFVGGPANVRVSALGKPLDTEANGIITEGLTDLILDISDRSLVRIEFERHILK